MTTKIDVIALHEHINETHDTLEMTFGRHVFTFGTEPDAVIYHVHLDDECINTQRVNLDISLFSLSGMMSKDTLQELEDNEDGISGSKVSQFMVNMALSDLLSYPPNFVSNERYTSLVKHLQRINEPFVIENDDVMTTIEYCYEHICVKTKIEGCFCRTNWFGRGETPENIAIMLHKQFEEITYPARLQNLPLLKEMLHDLSGYFLSE